MGPVEQFAKERTETVDSYARDNEFQSLSQDWLRESMRRRYVYNFDWLGRPIIQYPQDVAALQEIIWSTRPDIIIETGVAHGGSLVLSASILALLDYADAKADETTLDPARPSRRVIGVDIDIRPHNRAALEAHPMAPRIDLIEGSSVDQVVIDRVKASVAETGRVMVCLDSMHTHDHVLGELNAYGELVSPGCYCVVFDSFIEDMPRNFFVDRPWNVGNNPKTAVHSWLVDHPEFEIDKTIDQKLMISAAPDGYLKRIA
ncbi:MAG: cephalosporin hydroxylase family protein [Hyphomicrobiales bacterium]|nr:cephalosporin hydroxylase family protein [Hyphomicrobiales bacterium]